MLQGSPGRLLLVTPSGSKQTIAEGLPTPTGMVVDATTGEVFITHIFPGFITRINAAAALPHASPSAIVPVVASVSGAFNTHFTTSVQLSNPYPFAIAGRIVVHPAGASAAPSDPATPYSLAPFATTSIDSLVGNGSGSADILAAVGTAPVVLTTMTETASMNRMQIPTVDPAAAISGGMRATLITPADPSRQRFNIGIRTLGSGANIKIVAHDASGAVTSSVTRAFGPDFFQQFSFTELIGAPLGANEAVTFEVSSGSAIVYGSAVDKITGTMSLQLAHGVTD
jgi:hypothetical protein